MECKIRFIDKSLLAAFRKAETAEPRVYKELERAFMSISTNEFHGRQVKKKLIPKELIKKHEINNLWIYNLSSDWRLLYSLVNEEIQVLAIVLDWMDHKDYEKLFNF